MVRRDKRRRESCFEQRWEDCKRDAPRLGKENRGVAGRFWGGGVQFQLGGSCSGCRRE